MTPRRLNEIDQAIAAGTPAATFLPELLRELQAEPTLLRRLAHVFLLTGNWSRAVATVQLASALHPNDPGLKLEMGTIVSTHGGYLVAMDCYEHALRLAPDSAEALFARAQGNHLLSRMDEAIADYDQVLAAQPGTVQAQSFRIVARNYRDVEQDRILEESREYGRLLGQETRSLPWTHDAQRALRVGILSSDLRGHSVSFFLAPLLDRIPEGIEVTLFNDSVHHDEVTDRLKSLVDGRCHTVSATANDALEAQLLAHNFDVMVDLTGHFSRNRLPIFGHRVAPLQVSYLGYPNTTGVQAMNWRIGEIDIDTPDEWTERLALPESGMLAYEPPADAPPVAPKGPDKPVFGYFGQLSKVTDEVAFTWAKILAAMPEATLLIKSDNLSDPKSRDYWLQKLARAGLPTLDGDRVTLRDKTKTRAEHLAMYEEVSVSLDAWPYNGTTTICESLWMGVPVVTLEGRRHASRIAAALLRGIDPGKPCDLVAKTVDDYVTAAVQVATTRVRLRRADLKRARWLQHDEVARDFWSTLQGLKP